MHALRHQSFVSPQREPGHRENNEDASSVTSLSEEVQSKPDSDMNHISFCGMSMKVLIINIPLAFLTRKHTQPKTMEGIGFPTIKDFKQFIETNEKLLFYASLRN